MDLRKASTTYGVIGVKVWIYKGEVFEMQRPEKTRPVGCAGVRESC